ncbi:MAG TPA: lysophospholipid acyltransferase family protein [Iamia sp.]|nr:lysophospholipid acyltransferase family protein [Iamia sp.]
MTSERAAALAKAERRSGVHIYLGPPTRRERIVWAIAWHLLNGWTKLWFRVEYHGLEHLPADEPYILAPVHRSNIDFALAACLTRRRQRFMAKDTLWKPGFGVLWSALGGIPVARGTADREALTASQTVLEAGEPLVMFPEGTRQTGPVVETLFDGPAFVQARTGVPIVPVGIGGSEAAMPKGAKWIRPKKVVVVVGEPLPAPETEGAKARRAAVRTQTAALKERVQALFDDAQRRAGTPTSPGRAGRRAGRRRGRSGRPRRP